MLSNRISKLIAILLATAVILAGCTFDPGSPPLAEAGHDNTNERGSDSAVPENGMLSWPELVPVDLKGGKLRVVATTSIIGDVAAQVGGDAIELTTLMAPGLDPHSYEPSARALTAVANAHLIIINGWDLEEGLIATLESAAGNTPMVPISANIKPRMLDGGFDPHVWLDPHQAVQWTENLKNVFSGLNPANADIYAGNAAAYRQQLADLIAWYDEKMGAIPADGRQLVTNHDALGYLAQAYGFEVIGTVIPAASTLAEPSASGLTDLVAAMTAAQSCTIFTETTANDQLAQAAAAELTYCDNVNVVPLYTGALGLPGSGADTYIGMMRANLEAITAVLP